jgi:N-acetylglucosamine-6-sulfatase
MTRRHKVGLACVLVTLAVLGLIVVTGSRSAAHAAAPKRPNILILETDDQTLAEMEVLPNVRRLIGGNGVTFDNNFDSYSLCCPSRATLLTGQYSHNNGVRSNKPPNGGYYKLDSTNTLPVWLQAAGYYTAHVGKYLNGYGTRDKTEIPPGWTEWHGAVDPTTYRYYGYTLNENGVLHTYCSRPQASCYQTDVLREKADTIIHERALAPETPWFMWVAFLANHNGAPKEPGDPIVVPTPVPAPRHKGAFANVPMPRPPSFDEADVSDKPGEIRRRKRFTARDVREIEENWRQRRETLLAVDDAVVSIVETLRATGQLDNTLIMFTSDNGFFHGEHRVRWGKVLLYEPSIRVPLLMRWTGNTSLPRGVHRKQMSMNVDYAETVLAAAGATAQPGRIEDGISLLPLWRDPGKESGRDLLVDNQPGAGHFDAIRTRNYIYAEYLNGDRELYDLRKDPYELQSEHANPRYAPLRASLATRLHRLVTCAGASCLARPRVGVSLRRRGCLVTATVHGTGVQSVVFSRDRHGIKRDTRAPFQATVRLRGQGLIRARVALTWDRLLTVDALARGC